MHKVKPSPKYLFTFQGHTDSVNSVVFSQEKRLLISGSADRTIRLWDTLRGEQLKSIGLTSAVNSVDISCTDTVFASGHKNGSVRMYSISSNEKICEIQNLHEGQIPALKFSPDGLTLVTASTDNTIKITDMKR
jgi:WD40 repeat protein